MTVEERGLRVGARNDGVGAAILPLAMTEFRKELEDV